MGMSTPWGPAQTQKQLARGIIQVTTAGHGGIHLSPTLNAKVHEAWRDAKGWYEEDCEWAFVALTFPQHFAEDHVEYAHDSAKRNYPGQYARAMGVAVPETIGVGSCPTCGRQRQWYAGRESVECRVNGCEGQVPLHDVVRTHHPDGTTTDAAPDPGEPSEADVLREMTRVVRQFQRYTSNQRANRAASHRLTPGQQRAVGEHFYTHPDVPGRAFPKRRLAALAALRQPTPAPIPEDPAAPYTAAVQALNLPADWKWRVELRPRRRSIGATIEPGGQIIFAVPTSVKPDRFASLVASMRHRLGRMVADRARFSATKPVKELVNGEGFPLLGRNHRLRITEPGPQECCRMCREQVVRDPAVPVLAQRMHAAGLSSRPSYWLSVLPIALNAEAIIGWYQQQGQAWVDKHAPEWIARLRPAEGLRIVVRDIGRRKWGVYRPRKHLVELHWALFQLDQQFAEYVLVHELAHATRPGGQPHGPAWQRVMDRVRHDWRETRQRLGEAGDRVWFGDVTAPAERECRLARKRSIPFDCKKGAGHTGECSPYTLQPTGNHLAPPEGQPDPWGPTIRALSNS